MTDPESVKVEKRHRDAAADLIEEYWSGSDASMMKLAQRYRAGHSHGAFIRAFVKFDAEQTARIEELTRERDEARRLRAETIDLEAAAMSRALAAEQTIAAAVEVVDGIVVYATDTLSGRADGPADAKWLRDGFREIRTRATAFLASIKDPAHDRH